MPEVRAAAAHHRLRLLRPQLPVALVERVGDHLPPGQRQLSRQRLWQRAREAGRAGDRRHRAAAGLRRQRSARRHAGRRPRAPMLNRYGVAAGQRARACSPTTTAPIAAALDLADAGVAVAAIVDLRADRRWARCRPRRARKSIEVLAGHAITAHQGPPAGRAASPSCRLDASGDGVAGAPREIDCDLRPACPAAGTRPCICSRSRAASCASTTRIAAFVPDTRGAEASARPAPRTAASRSPIASPRASTAGAGGRRAMPASARAVRHARRAPHRPARTTPLRPVWVVPSDKPVGHGGKHFVDLQNDVTAADMLLAAREGYRSVEHLKRYTTMGMGTDQGKTSNVNALGDPGADARPRRSPAGRHHHLPPALHAGHLRRLRRPRARRPARSDPPHADASLARAARRAVRECRPVAARLVLPEARARACTTPSSARARRCAPRVGILDASTLGKIDIQGPDAVELLNWVYTNAWSKLEVGRCRYGLMLRRGRHGVRRRRHHAPRRTSLPA